MKISKLFHWLYASVMFLPLLIIPIFAIWTINHDNNQAITIDVSRNKVVDFNQQFDYNEARTWFLNGTGSITYDVNSVTFSNDTDSLNSVYTSFDFDDNSIYYLSCVASSTNGGSIIFGWHTGYYSEYTNLTSTPKKVSNISYLTNANSIYLYVYNNGVATDINVSYINLINLTKMFGSGNEPSLQEFNQWYSDDYYAYTISKTELLKDYEIVTYDNTDVGSQFIYTLYRSCEEYLNFDDVLSLGSISDWIETNVFNGNAPLVYTIVWHYLDYWLILSIFWLCFDVLIYVPQIAHRWLDKASLE